MSLRMSHEGRVVDLKTLDKEKSLSRKDENYRYTRLEQYNWEEVAESTEARTSEDWKKIITTRQEDELALIAMSDLLENTVQELEAGLKITVSEDLTQFPEVQKLFKECPEKLKDDFFVQNIFSQEAKTLLIKIPDGLVLEKAIRVSHWISEKTKNYFERVTIVVGKGARVQFINELNSAESKDEILLQSFLHLHVEDDAYVKFFHIQDLAKQVVFADRHYISCGSNVEVEHFTLHCGAQKGQHRVLVNCSHSNTKVKCHATLKLKDKQHIDFWVDNQHFCPRTQSDTHVWNVLEDNAVGVFNGNIEINENGMLTEAYQHNKTLLLSDKARVHTMPKLEIATDDVKCSHGASIATLDEQQLFYLRSRGLSFDKAEKILINAFSFPVVSQIPVQHLLEKYLDSGVE